MHQIFWLFRLQNSGLLNWQYGCWLCTKHTFWRVNNHIVSWEESQDQGLVWQLKGRGYSKYLTWAWSNPAYSHEYVVDSTINDAADYYGMGDIRIGNELITGNKLGKAMDEEMDSLVSNNTYAYTISTRT